MIIKDKLISFNNLPKQIIISSPVRWITKLPNQKGALGDNIVSWDVILSLPMFLRLYLICRVMLLHSKVSDFRTIAQRSFDAYKGTTTFAFGKIYFVIFIWYRNKCLNVSTVPHMQGYAAPLLKRVRFS